MSKAVADQIRLQMRAVDADQSPIDLDEILTRVETRGPSSSPRFIAGWAVAAVAFVIVLVFALPFLLNRGAVPPATNPSLPPTTIPTTLPSVDVTQQIDTVLGTVAWTRLEGDLGSLPGEWFVHNPIDDTYITQSGQLVSTDGYSWEPSDSDDARVSSFRWGDYARFSDRFGVRRDGIWSDIDLPVPDVGSVVAGATGVNSVAVSGERVVVSGWVETPSGDVPVVWVSDEGLEFTAQQAPWSTFGMVFPMPGSGFGVDVDSPLDERGLWISDDGVVWTRTLPQFLVDEADRGMEAWSVTERGGNLIAGLDYGEASGTPSHREWISTDGVTWTPYANPFEGLAPDLVPSVRKVGRGYVASTTSQPEMWGSLDGVEWALLDLPTEGVEMTLPGVAGDILYQFAFPDADTIILWIGRFE